MRITALPIICLALLLSACTATSTPPPKVTVSSAVSYTHLTLPTNREV